jgi:hypothetical protein
MKRLSSRVRDGLNGLAAIGETVLDCNGEGWGLECMAGNDQTACNRPDCETCRDRENVSKACAYIRQLAARPRRGKRGTDE